MIFGNFFSMLLLCHNALFFLYGTGFILLFCGESNEELIMVHTK